MATTSQTEIGTNTKSDSKSYSYPAGIAGVPFASFLRIYKYSYDEGMANVASQQNDVQGALQNSGLLKNITDGVADTAQFAYGDKTGGNEYLALSEDKALAKFKSETRAVSYTHLRAHETS